MNLQHLGRIIATTTILMGVLVGVIGALLAYAIPDSPQAFVDWVQNKQYNDVISSVATTINNHTSSTATTRPAVVPEISSNAPTPGSTPGATTNPAIMTPPGSSQGRLSVGIEAERAIGGPTALTLLSKGAALGGATGLILGLPLGVAIAVLQQLILWVRAVIDAVRNMFSNLRSTVFRR